MLVERTEIPVHPSPRRETLDDLEWTRRDVRILGDGGRVVFEQLGVEAPAGWSDRAVTVVASKYFRGHVGSPGREDSVRQVIERIAFTIAGWAAADHYVENAGPFGDELALLLATQRLAFNTPVWLNVGVDDVPQCSACYISSVEDTMESITDFAAREARIFQRGGGSGTNLSRLRASNERLSRGGVASGPVSFMRPLDAFAGVIKSGGRMRRAAKLVALNVDHPDILEFVRCKVEEEAKARALAAAGYSGGIDGDASRSVFFQNANNSVRVTDAFMRAVEEDGTWDLLARVDGSIVRTIRARELMREISTAAHACGCPGLQFDDAANFWHTVPGAGRINASNPCAEFVFLDDSACNLSSLNLRAFQSRDGLLDVRAFRRAVDVAVTAMDVVVDRSSYPTEEIAANSRRYRPLGLGYANLGAFLAYRGLPYDSPDARALAGAVTALMTARATRTSADLARVLGSFEGCEGALEVARKHRDATMILEPSHEADAARSEFETAVSMAGEYGLRNSQLTLLAPTGTIGFVMDCFTADTRVAVADGRNAVSFGELAREGRDVDVYASKDGRTVVRRMRNIRKVRDAVALLRVHLDDGSSVRCTPEHQFMLRDGTYRRADELTTGTSLMRFDSVVEDEEGIARRKIWMGPDAGGNRSRGRSWVYQYRLSGARLFPGYDARSGGIVHHENEDSLDDRYENLIYCGDIGAHQRAHWAKKSAAERSEILRARQSSRSPEERRDASRKAHAAQTPDQRRARGLKAVSRRTAKEMSDAAKRGWEKRRANAGRNHKVVYVVQDGVEDVYCGQVEEVRNFAIVTNGFDPKGGDLSGVVVHNCDTTGIEPILALRTRKSLVGGGEMISECVTLPPALEALGYDSGARHRILEHLAAEGTLLGAPGFRDSHVAIFDGALPDGAGRSISVDGHLDMMAAVQPFLSGAISKTVNLPGEASLEEVEETYIRAWRLGLKSIAVYVDGSKTVQPVESVRPRKKNGNGNGNGHKEEVGRLAALEPGAVTSTRLKLPDEARTIRQKFEIGGAVEGYVHVGLYDDGRVGEMFVRASKEGSTISGLLDALATAVSIGLQHGVPLETFVRKFAHWRFEPSGYSTDVRIGYANSIVDYIFRWLGIRFPGGRDSDAAEPVQIADASNLCGECGGTLQRSGSCHVCSRCGTTTGCS